MPPGLGGPFANSAAGATSSGQTGLQAGQPADAELSSQELQLVYKSLPGVDLPTVDAPTSGVLTKADKIMHWRQAVAVRIRSTRSMAEEWWSWVYNVADSQYKAWAAV